jgi:hypothetical protein
MYPSKLCYLGFFQLPIHCLRILKKPEAGSTMIFYRHSCLHSRDAWTIFLNRMPKQFKPWGFLNAKLFFCMGGRLLRKRKKERDEKDTKYQLKYVPYEQFSKHYKYCYRNKIDIPSLCTDTSNMDELFLIFFHSNMYI